MDTNNFANNVEPDPQNPNAQPTTAQTNQNVFYPQASQGQVSQPQTTMTQPPQGQAPEAQTLPEQNPYTSSNSSYQAAPYNYGAQPIQNQYYSSSTPTPPIAPQGYPYSPAPYQRWNSLCIAGFVLSFLSPVLGLILSIISLTQINRTGEKSKGLATAGIVISAIYLTIVAVLIFSAVAILSGNVDNLEDDDTYCEGTDCDPYSPEDSDPNDKDTDTETNETYYLYHWQQALPASSFVSAR